MGRGRWRFANRRFANALRAEIIRRTTEESNFHMWNREIEDIAREAGVVPAVVYEAFLELRGDVWEGDPHRTSDLGVTGWAFDRAWLQRKYGLTYR